MNQDKTSGTRVLVVGEEGTSPLVCIDIYRADPLRLFLNPESYLSRNAKRASLPARKKGLEFEIPRGTERLLKKEVVLLTKWMLLSIHEIDA